MPEYILLKISSFVSTINRPTLYHMHTHTYIYMLCYTKVLIFDIHCGTNWAKEVNLD